jgi:hypothetical protein
MKSPLVPTSNTLVDIINWLKSGDIVCIHSGTTFQYYFSRETTDSLTDERLILIDVSSMPGLLLESEWPVYIKEAGFKDYQSINVLPTNIFHFSL